MRAITRRLRRTSRPQSKTSSPGLTVAEAYALLIRWAAGGVTCDQVLTGLADVGMRRAETTP